MKKNFKTQFENHWPRMTRGGVRSKSLKPSSLFLYTIRRFAVRSLMASSRAFWPRRPILSGIKPAGVYYSDTSSEDHTARWGIPNSCASYSERLPRGVTIVFSYKYNRQ